MTDGSFAEDPSRYRLFQSARGEAGWTVEELWVHYLAVGGTQVFFDLDAYLAGLMPLSVPQQDVLACALNERLADLQQSTRLPYLTELPHWLSEDTLNVLRKQPPEASSD